MLKFEGTNLSDSQISHIVMADALRAIMVGSGGGEFNPGNACTGTLTVSQLQVSNAEVRTGGYGTSAKLILDGSTITSANVTGQYPNSEPIEIRNSNISSSTVLSDSYNYGIILDNTTASKTQFQLGCCGANFDIRNSTLFDSLVEGREGGPVKFSYSKLINSSVNLPSAIMQINNSIFSFNSTPGLSFGSGSITASSFIGQGTGVGVQFSGCIYNCSMGSLVVSNSTFVDFATAIRLTGANTVSIETNNNFLRNSTYTIENRTAKPIAAKSNFWDTTNLTQIASKIFDYFDDISYGAVDSSGFLNSPSSAAPISRPIGVQATVSGNDVVLAWTANPESDVAGYKIYYDTDSGYPYANSVTVGHVTGHTLSGLASTGWYIAVTAIDSSADGTADWTDGNESWFSSEVTAALGKPEVTFSQAATSAGEAAGSVTMTVQLSKAYNLPVTVQYATANGTAAAGSDYTATSGTLTFAAGETSKTFPVSIADDSLDETDETVNLTLSSPGNATLGAPSAAVLTITDNDGPAVRFRSSGFSAGEGAGSAVIYVDLTAASPQTITVQYATGNGTAVAEADYAATSGTLTFIPGDTTRSFAVGLVDDGLDETDETVQLTLSSVSATAALGSPAAALLTILDNDGPQVFFHPSSYSVPESAGSASLTVQLSYPSVQIVTVDYSSSNGTALAGSDFAASSGTLTFSPGETAKTFSVSIIDDSADELDESLSLTLSGPTRADPGSPPTASLTILDNDGPAVQFSSSAFSAGEADGSIPITVSLSAPSPQTITVGYSTSNGTATAGSDYQSAAGTLNFSPGETGKTFQVAVLDDTTLMEFSETVLLALSNPVNAFPGSPASATLTVVENDLSAPPVTVAFASPKPPRPPVTVPLSTHAGTVQVIFNDLWADGSLSAVVSIVPPGSTPEDFTLLRTSYALSAAATGGSPSSSAQALFSSALVQFPYSEADVAAAGVSEASLRLLHYENGKWKDVTTALDTGANIITGKVDSLSSLYPFVIGVLNLLPCTITINNGAPYTGQRQVQIFSSTVGVKEMMVSNDAGFAHAKVIPYQSAFSWTLSDLGTRIVTLLVYMRMFDSSGQPMCYGLNLSDDIVYDPLPPTVSVAAGSSRRAEAAESASSTVTLRILAEDQLGGSGVADMKIGTSPDLAGAPWQPYSYTATVSAKPGDQIYVGVRDAVGNVSGITGTKVTTGMLDSNNLFLPLVLRP